MTSRLLLLSSSCLALLSGCVLHSPYKVVRYSVDYNSERHVNAQVEAYDHLPLKPTRVKLMRWGYNVGPLPSGTGTCGWGTGRCKGNCESGECEPGMVIDGYVVPPMTTPAAPVIGPVVPPPVPPANARTQIADPNVRVAAHQSPANAKRAGWLFGGPAGR